MSCKTAIYTANTGPQTVASGGTISPGGVIRRYGQGITLSGNNITLSAPGYYLVNVSVTASPTVAGTVNVALQNSGVAVPGAISSGSVSTAANPTTLSFPAVIRVPCGGNLATLTLVLGGNASIVNNVALSVIKL
jgi:hypothetical protein